MKYFFAVLFIVLAFSSCTVTKTYRLDGKLKPYTSPTDSFVDLDWKNFDSLLMNAYLPIEWSKKNRYKAYKNIIIIRTSPRNAKKFEKFFCQYWASIYDDKFVKEKFDFCNCYLKTKK